MNARGRVYDREIARLAVPALGSLAAEPLYILVDTAVVGHLGTRELGGLAVAGTLLTTGFFLFNFLAYGTTAAVARAFGGGDERGAASHAVHGLWAAALLGVVSVVGWLVFAAPAVDVMGASSEVRPFALTYLRISALGAPAMLIMLAGMGYSRGLQDTRTPLVIALGSNAANLVVEVVLIFGVGWGIEASAWATVWAQWGGAAVYLALMLRAVRAAGVPLRPRAREARAMATMSGHLFLRTGSLLTALTVATAIAARMGTAPVAAHQIAFQVWSFLALVLDAIAIAGQAMIGRLLGAGDAAGARAAAGRMIRWGVVAGVAFGVGVAVLRPMLGSAFSPDPSVSALLGDVFWIVAALQPLNAVVFVLDGVLIGAGDARYLAAAMAAALVVFLPLALAIGAARAGLVPLWGAIAALMLVRLAGMTGRFVRGAWQVVGAR